ncbi:MAG: hypothetical protein U9N33_04825 [Campylobacterota bacterium]|nr:hypothetical protein [Campylobacterota bacterium]
MWTLYSSKIFDTGDRYIGDLARMSYQLEALFPRKTETTIRFKHIDKTSYKNQKIDVITIGDSFFNGGGGGLNPFFQDYLAEHSKKNILNIQLFGNSMDIVNILINSGWLNEIKPHAVVIESTAREVVPRFSYAHDFNKTLTLAEVKGTLFSDIWNFHKQDVYFINSANYKIPFYSLLYNYKDHAQKSVYKLNLNQEMFSIPNYKNILIYKDDIQRLHQQNLANLTLVNDNFNKLALKLNKLNIKLFFMPIVDKYDLYYKYIIDNKYTQNNFFDILEPMDKKYNLVNTKKMLEPLLQKNIKDIFYSDDTHWSYKASDEVAKKLAKDLFK